MSGFWKDFPQIENELNAVQAIMKKNLKSRQNYIEEAILPMVDSGGKMLRPAFVLLAGGYGDDEKKKLHTLAAAIESLHLATLIHDDVIDESNLRRGVETIQSKYGKNYAVYMGDFLFCQCIMMLADFDYSMENLRELSKVISRICMSEIQQYHLRFKKNATMREYIRIISGKTAALFAISLFVGAKESNCDDKLTKLFGKIGYNIGMAFQIIDDLLDFNGATKALGKGAQKDLKRGYYTLPVIFALEKDDNGQLADLLGQPKLEEQDVQKILALVEEYEGIERARQVAHRYSEKAYKLIRKLPDHESKDILLAIIPKLLDRDY